MPDIAETDWKAPRRVHPLAVDRFCERVLREVERVMHNSVQSHPERYLELFQLVQQRDRDIARLFDNPRRSRALTMLAQIRAEGLLTEEEFSSLGQKTRSAIEMLLSTR